MVTFMFFLFGMGKKRKKCTRKKNVVFKKWLLLNLEEEPRWPEVSCKWVALHPGLYGSYFMSVVLT